MKPRTEPLRAAGRESRVEPAAQRSEPDRPHKRGWLPIDTVAAIVAAMTMFAVPYSLNQDGIALEGMHILDVMFGVS